MMEDSAFSGDISGGMSDCDNDLKANISVTKNVPSQERFEGFGKEQSAQEPLSKPKQPNEKKAGYAAIKSEFLLHDYKPTLQSKYLSEQTKKELGDALIKEETKNGDTSLGKHPSAQDDNGDDNDEEPSTKKAKLKGRNKHRPQNERICEKDKLCPSIKVGKDCTFGDRCKYRHDRKDFYENKLPDLLETCPIFKQFGFCRSGISCRYAKSHLSDHLENVVNDELYDKMKSSLVCYNVLSDEVKHKLWKRKFNFSKAMKAVKNAQKMLDPSKYKDAEKSSCGTSESFEKNAAVPSPEGVTECNEKKEISGTPVLKDNDLLQDKKIDDSDIANAVLNKEGSSQDDTDMFTEERKAEIDSMESVRTLGDITDEELIRVRPQEKRKIHFKNKLYLAPLTTVGNLPFRRVCKGLGADVTCGEMALASQLLKGKLSEWSLIKRHPCEDLFGVQICGAYPDMMAKCAQVLSETTKLDFIDINCGCPIDLIFKKGAGSALLGKVTKLEQISRSMIDVMGDMPLTVKIRTGVYDHKQIAHTLIPRLRDAGVSLVTLHGRSREQRYTKLADWEYISKCAEAGAPMPVFGNGDILSYEDANLHMESNVISGVMIARGALIKPWIFTEIKEQRHWDISANERFDILKSFTNYGLEHWGSDHQGLENTRRFLLEWLSFLHRYIPVGVLEQAPQRINERPPYYIGRNDLETLMASANCADWIKLSEMLLGPVPPDFRFLPKHKANAYQ